MEKDLLSMWTLSVPLCSHHFVPKWTTSTPISPPDLSPTGARLARKVREQEVWKTGSFQKVLLQKPALVELIPTLTIGISDIPINLIPFGHCQYWTEFLE